MEIWVRKAKCYDDKDCYIVEGMQKEPPRNRYRYWLEQKCYTDNIPTPWYDWIEEGEVLDAKLPIFYDYGINEQILLMNGYLIGGYNE